MLQNIIGGGIILDGFSPSSLTGMQLWLDAGQIVGNDGDLVATWSDASGNGRNFTAAGTARPTLKRGITPSGGSVVRFNGTANILTAASWNTGLTSGEGFIVVKIAVDPPVSAANTTIWAFGSSAAGNHMPFTNGDFFDDFGQTTRPTEGNPTPSFATAFRLYNASSALNSFFIRVDTTQLYTNATNTVGWRAAPTLGGEGTDFGTIDIAEIAVYSPVLSAGNRAALEQYFKTKYGLSGY